MKMVVATILTLVGWAISLAIIVLPAWFLWNWLMPAILGIRHFRSRRRWGCWHWRVVFYEHTRFSRFNGLDRASLSRLEHSFAPLKWVA